MEDILSLVDEAIEEHQRVSRCLVDSQAAADDEGKCATASAG